MKIQILRNLTAILWQTPQSSERRAIHRWDSSIKSLAACFLWAAALCARAQSGFTVLHHFAGGPNDGATPANTLLLLDGTFYGTTEFGGTANLGTVFAIGTNGTGFTNLHSFTGAADGRMPVCSLTPVSGRLFGVALQGGSSGNGTLFGITTDGSGFSVLHHFFGGVSDGSQPYAAPIFSEGTLYGTTYNGGSRTNGMLYSISTNGTGYLNLYNFTNGPTRSGSISGVTAGGSRLYGAIERGGSSSAGSLFSISTNGTGFSNLHTFTGTDGSVVDGCPLLAGDRLYGVTYTTIYAMNTNGTGFTNLHTFQTATEGNNIFGGLVLIGDTLFGMASRGGPGDTGTLFCMRTNGAGFTILHNFQAATDGSAPFGGLVVSGNTLYGLTSAGGSFSKGTLFSFNPTQALGTDQLGIVPSGNQVVLFWPAWATNVTLQTTTDLANGPWTPFTNGTPIIGLLTANNGSNAFFRLQPH